jgi:hypothetical protein
MSLNVSQGFSPPPPRVANQRTGGVFNLQAGEKIARENISDPLAILILNRVYGELDRLLLNRNIFSNSPIHFLHEGEKAVKMIPHPEKKDLLVILTNEHALGFPEDQVERMPYVKSTSELGDTFLVGPGENVNAFWENTLLPDLNIEA